MKIPDLSPVDIHLLGSFSFTYHATSLPSNGAPRLPPLLAYLILHPDTEIPRKYLAALLWPDTGEAQAQANLRKHLFRLREGLPTADAWIVASRFTIRWVSSNHVRVDLNQFRSLLEQSTTAEPQVAILLLRQAIECYKGEFLPGNYDEWILAIRENLQTQYLTALTRLSDLLEDRRMYDEAIQTSQQLLHHDPLNEASYRRLIRLYALNDERAAALRTYHLCVSQLHEELGIDPDEATQALYEQLLNGASLAAMPQPELAANAPFIGRQAEWQQLQSRWRSALHGTPQFVLIAGEAGIGKTRLAEEMLSWANHQSFVSVRSRCYAAEGRLTYAPIIEWLRAESIRQQRNRLARTWQTELSRLLPEILNENPTLPPPEPITQSAQRHHLFEAATRALLTGEQPLLLLIDDLQWCDKETLELLHFLLRNATTLGQSKLMLIGTARLPDEVDANHPLYELLNPLRVSDSLTQLDLKRLTAAETSQLATQMAEQQLDEHALKQLFADTDGNPLFVVETMRATDIQLTHNGSPDFSVILSINANQEILQHLPPKVLAVIQSRLAQLSPTAHELCEWAATIGRSFTFDLLSAASNITPDKAVSALDELWQRRIIREHGSDAYDFSHDRIRDVAAAGVSRVRRKFLHRCVAEALERSSESSIDNFAAQIAVQFEAAGMVRKAIYFYTQAADHAAKTYANEQTVAHLQRTIALLRTLPESRERDQREFAYLTALVPPLAAVTNSAITQMYEVHERAYVLSQQLGINLHPSMLRVMAIHKIARRAFVQAEEMGYQLLKIAQQSEVTDKVVYFEGCYVIGVALFWQGHFQQAQTYLEQTANEYSTVRKEHHLIEYGQETGIYCRTRLAFTLWYLGYPEQAQRECETSLMLARQLRHPFTLFLVLAYSAWYLLTARETEYAERLFRSREVGDRPLSDQYERQFGFFDGSLLLLRKQTDKAIHLFNEFSALRRKISTDGTQYPFGLTLLAEAYYQAGDYEKGFVTLEDALAMINYNENFWLVAEMHRTKGELLRGQGKDLVQAEACFQKSLEISRRQQAKSLELRAAMSLARLWKQQDKRSEARELLAGVYNWFTEGFDTADLQDAKALLEQLA